MASIVEEQRLGRTTGWIGKSVERLEDERLLRGLSRFVDDHDLPRMLHMAVARSPHPHARILRIDVSRARELDGVAAILLGDEVVRRTETITVLRPVPDAPPIPYHALAGDVVLFEGQPVVSVVAADRYVAEDAVDLLEIEYQPLPHLVDVEAALEPGAPRLHEQIPGNLLVANPRTMGDPDAAFESADVVLEDRFAINRVIGLPMEGRGVLVDYKPGSGELTIWSSTQTPHLNRRQLAHALRLPEAMLHVIAPNLGGGFGLKCGIYPEDILACLHALDLGRPIKWVEDRTEHFRATTHAREAVHRAGIAGGRDGRILAVRDTYLVSLGAYNSPFGSPMLSSLMFPGPYRIEHCYTERRVVLTNKTPVGAYRGYGQPESNFVRELLVDRFARTVGIDPVDVRRRNLIAPEELPWQSGGGAFYDSGDYGACLELALERIDYDGFRRAQPELRADGRHVGVGVSCFVEMTGYPGSRFLGKHHAQYGAHESVTIRANRSGGVDLYTGVAAMGQSTETAYAQVCATMLGIHPREVRVHAGDTRGTPYNTGSFASRTLIAGAGAIRAAAGEVRSKALRVAGHLIGVDPAGLEIVDGIVQAVDNPDLRIALAEVATQAFFGHDLPPDETPGLEATAYFDPTASAFGYGTAAAVVDVDPRTGEFRVERFVLVHDCGLEVNPMIVEGQVMGALAQGIGAALFEELVYDPETGQLVNGTMIDYFMPTAADLPLLEVSHTETPSPVTPFGVRGIGESGTIPPGAAIANAICDALAPFGVEINRLPITPEAIWRLVEQARSRRPAPSTATPR